MSHKRNSSTAGNADELPEFKRVAQDDSSKTEKSQDQGFKVEQPQRTIVYAVTTRKDFGKENKLEEPSTIGIYSSLSDANNKVCQARDDYWTLGRIEKARNAMPRYSGRVDNRGCAFWEISPTHSTGWQAFVCGISIQDITPTYELPMDWTRLSGSTPWEDTPFQKIGEDQPGDRGIIFQEEYDGEEDEDYSEGENDRPWH